MRRMFEGEPPRLTLPGGPASPHDLRRTMRTHLGKLRVPLHIVERCLNHSLGRIVQTYDQGDYLDERREALEKWDAYLRRLLAPEASNVAFLPTAAGGVA
jgi:integrase